MDASKVLGVVKQQEPSSSMAGAQYARNAFGAGVIGLWFINPFFSVEINDSFGSAALRPDCHSRMCVAQPRIF